MVTHARGIITFRFLMLALEQKNFSFNALNVQTVSRTPSMTGAYFVRSDSSPKFTLTEAISLSYVIL